MNSSALVLAISRPRLPSRYHHRPPAKASVMLIQITDQTAASLKLTRCSLPPPTTKRSIASMTRTMLVKASHKPVLPMVSI